MQPICSYNDVDDVGGPVQDRLPETAAQPQEEDSRHWGAGTSKPKGTKIFFVWFNFRYY